MAIDADKITSDLTLELDEEEISIADFGRAYDSFVGLVKEVTKNVAPEKSASAWTVKVYPGSAGLGLTRSGSEITPFEVAGIQRAIISGLEALASGTRPIGFSDKAIEHSKNLASLFKSKKVDPAVRVWSKAERALTITRKMGTNANELLAPAYEETGTVDGILERLDAHGKLQFVIYEVVGQRSIKCEVDDKLLEQAWNAFRKRVEVIGSVRYRKDGVPVSIKASRIVPFPDPSEIPSLEQMRRLLSGNP